MFNDFVGHMMSRFDAVIHCADRRRRRLLQRNLDDPDVRRPLLDVDPEPLAAINVVRRGVEGGLHRLIATIFLVTYCQVGPPSDRTKKFLENQKPLRRKDTGKNGLGQTIGGRVKAKCGERVLNGRAFLSFEKFEPLEISAA